MSTWLDDLHAEQAPTLREWIAEHDVSDGFVHCLTEQAMAELTRIADNQEREVVELFDVHSNTLAHLSKTIDDLRDVVALAQDALKMADALWRMDGTRSELKRLHERARALGVEVDG